MRMNVACRCGRENPPVPGFVWCGHNRPDGEGCGRGYRVQMYSIGQGVRWSALRVLRTNRSLVDPLHDRRGVITSIQFHEGGDEPYYFVDWEGGPRSDWDAGPYWESDLSPAGELRPLVDPVRR